MITEFEEFIGSVRMVLDEQDGDDALIGRIVKIYWDEIQATGYKCAAADELLAALEAYVDWDDAGAEIVSPAFVRASRAIAKAKGVETK